MNLEALHRKLIKVAQATPPGDQVPYAFEKRILARLAERRAADLAGTWARALWRSAAACVAVMLVLGVWSFAASDRSTATTGSTENFDQQFENALLAGIDQSEEIW